MGRKSSRDVLWLGARGVGRFGSWLGSQELHFGADGEMLRHNEGNGGGIWRYGETQRRNGETWKHGETDGETWKYGELGEYGKYGGNGKYGENGGTGGEKCGKI